MTRLEQSQLVATALEQLATQLRKAGVPTDVIAPAALGWAVGTAASVVEPETLAHSLRDTANRVDGFAIPVSGSA